MKQGVKLFRRAFLTLSPVIAVVGVLSVGSNAAPVLLAILAISILGLVSYRLAPSAIRRG
jgi:hypothetical protein